MYIYAWSSCSNIIIPLRKGDTLRFHNAACKDKDVDRNLTWTRLCSLTRWTLHGKQTKKSDVPSVMWRRVKSCCDSSVRTEIRRNWQVNSNSYSGQWRACCQYSCPLCGSVRARMHNQLWTGYRLCCVYTVWKERYTIQLVSLISCEEWAENPAWTLLCMSQRWQSAKEEKSCHCQLLQFISIGLRLNGYFVHADSSRHGLS